MFVVAAGALLAGLATAVVVGALVVTDATIFVDAGENSRFSISDNGTRSSLAQLVAMTTSLVLSERMFPSNRSPFFRRRITLVWENAASGSRHATARSRRESSQFRRLGIILC